MSTNEQRRALQRAGCGCWLGRDGEPRGRTTILIMSFGDRVQIKMDADNCHTCGILGIRPHTVCGVSRRQPTRAVCGRILELPTHVGASYSLPHAQQVLLISIPRAWHEAKMPTRPGAATLGTRGMTI